MKNLVGAFRAQPLHTRVLVLVQTFAIVFLLLLLGMEKANAQAGDIYAPHQAQSAGDVWEGQVLQVSVKEVEPSFQARAAGAAVGGALGLALSSRSNSEHRFAVNTVGTVLGGLLGERAASTFARNEAQEIVVRVRQPGQAERLLVIVQPSPYTPVAAGEMVYVTMVNGSYRVLKRSGLL